MVWWFLDARELPRAARAFIEEPANRVVVSVASLWELAIRVSRGRMQMRLDRLPAAIDRDGFEVLPVLPAHALAVIELPRHHADPFDRMLIAQARSEGFSLLTADKALSPYGEPVMLV
jgi:PIN domain nuclease of toxin-antitoxin system